MPTRIAAILDSSAAMLEVGRANAAPHVILPRLLVLTNGKTAASLALASSAIMLADGGAAEALARASLAVLLADARAAPSQPLLCWPLLGHLLRAEAIRVL
jgi:hypothetical protein